MTTNNDQQAKLGEAAKSNLWFYPGEELKQGQMRVTLMGTGWGNVVGPSQKGPSIFVELGNENQDSFVFDVGPGCILNYNAMDIPMSRMNKIFISHLHMDHCSDLPFIYAFGPNLGDRFDSLDIYGPSGPNLLDKDGAETDTKLGIRNMVEGMVQFTQWHTTSFKTMTNSAEESYNLDHHVHEFDFRKCGGIAYRSGIKGFDTDHVIIKHFPAIHIIDGAVSYRLEWSPAGTDEYFVFVYSGDTLPSDFMLEYGKGAHLMLHETAPSVDSIMNGTGATKEDAYAIVCNSHTPANSLGSILAKTKPLLGVTTHSPMDPRSIEDLILGVRQGIAQAKNDKGKNSWDKNQAYQVGADLMVFNIGKGADNKAFVTTRMSAGIDRPWPVRIETTEDNLAFTKTETFHYQKEAATGSDNSDLNTRIFGHINPSQDCIDYQENQDDSNGE